MKWIDLSVDPRNRVRIAQQRSAAIPAGSVANRAEREGRRIQGLKSWRKVKRPKPRYVILVERTGKDPGAEPMRHVIGPYLIFKRAEFDAREWSVDPWKATILPLEDVGAFSVEEQ